MFQKTDHANANVQYDRIPVFMNRYEEFDMPEKFHVEQAILMLIVGYEAECILRDSLVLGRVPMESVPTACPTF